MSCHRTRCLLIVFIDLGLLCTPCYSKAKSGLILLDLISFGLDVFDFISGFLQNDEDVEVKINQDQLNKLVANIEEIIKAATNTIVFTIKFELYLQDLRDMEDAVRETSEDLKNVFLEVDLTKRKKYISRFIATFERNKSKISKIDSLLIGTGIYRESLIGLVTINVRCSIGDLDDFERYYMTMASGGMGLSLAYEALQNETTFYEKQQRKWITIMANLSFEFETARNKCISNFTAMAKEDFRTVDNDTVLVEQNRRKYADKSNDVLRIRTLFLARYRNTDSNIFITKSNGLRLSVFSERVRTPTLHNQTLDIFKKETKKNCNENIQTTFENMKQIVDDMLTWQSHEISLKMYILYEDDNATNYQNIEEDSSAISVSVNCANIVLHVYLDDANATHYGFAESSNIYDRVSSNGSSLTFLTFYLIFVLTIANLL